MMVSHSKCLPGETDGLLLSFYGITSVFKVFVVAFDGCDFHSYMCLI